MIRLHSLRFIALFAAVGVAFASCGDSGGGGPEEQVPTSIVVTNGSLTIGAIGGSLTLQVSVRDQSGRAISNPPTIQFTSLNSAVATVSNGGVVTAIANGTADIAIASGTVQTTVTVTVMQMGSGVAGVSGNAQTGVVGQALGAPLVVRVTDAGGNAVAGETVSFAVTAGNGNVSSPTATTDGAGEASVTWTLGTTAGMQQVTATLGGAQALFTATAEADVATTILFANDRQEGVAGFALLRPLAVLVEDQFGNNVVGVQVNLAASDGGATTPGSVTSIDGLAFFDWTLGAALGEQTVTATAGALTENATATAVNATPAALGVPQGGQNATAGQALHYTFQTPPTVIAALNDEANVIQPALKATVTGGSGNRELFVRFGSPPASSDGGIISDCFDPGPGTEKMCEIPNPADGTWFASVLGIAGFTGATVTFDFLLLQPDLTAGGLTVTPPTPTTAQTVTIQGSVTNNGTLASGEFMWRIEVDGAPVADGTISDLAPGQTQLVAANNVGPFALGAHTATLIVDTKDEVMDANPADNTSSAPFTVTAVPTGMITVKKTVVSSDDGPPNNPVDQTLMGFEFQVKEAGTATVVQTQTTDASGEAKFTVPVGNYDVMESNSQSLEDVTMAANGIAVTQGGNVDVPWTNRQDPIPMGMITINKIVLGSDGGLPNNPEDQTLMGFEFEIKEAGTSDVVATVMTDEEGVAKATVPVGMYDIMESDSQGLDDITELEEGVEVTEDGNEEIDWTNQQFPPAMGMILVKKVIQSSTGGAPDNPDDPDLDGFEFQVKEGGTANVVATGMTDPMGEVKFTVPVGTYDVMESNSKMLTDFTVNVAGIVVEEMETDTIMWVNRQGPTGTITVQKTVTASDGTTADNPMNPTLLGFVFDIKEAGTANVVATVTTDAMGKATKTVPVGTYDVMETNSQGLTDFTMNAAGVVVTAGNDTNVPWENRQSAAPMGTITVQKAVTASDGMTANNPMNPSLNGFVFDIKEAGTANVVATATTDLAGNGVVNVPPGTYDVMETNSQGLTDFTMNAAGVVVTDGNNTNVPWENRQAAPGNMPPTAVINGAPMSVPAGDGNSTVVMLNGGNSTDPEGDPLTYSWSVAPGGTFVGGIDTGPMVSITFPGAAPYTVTLTVDDGNGNMDSVDKIIGLDAALPAAGTFDIVIDFIVNGVSVAPTGPQAAAFAAAEARWESIVRSELADIDFGPGGFDAELCGSAAPADMVPDVTGVVDDLHIFVFLEAIDGAGGVLGRAGPCVSRLPTPLGFPILGSMTFDIADLATLEGDGTLAAVILHEMGHVLGIGSLWPAPNGSCDPFGHSLLAAPSVVPTVFSGDCLSVITPATNVSPIPDTRFLGAQANEAYRALGGSSGEATPVENGSFGPESGPGNRDAHWREITFLTELMTPFIGAAEASSPLSKLTIASLMDLGYLVNFAPADDYMIPMPISTVQGAPGSRAGHFLKDDIRRGPIWIADTEGRIVGVMDGNR